MTRVCISIAVSAPEGALDPLPGALEASRAIVNWATAAKFDIAKSISDAETGAAVTTAELRELFMPILSNAQEVIEHLVVHFAGHGFTDQTDDQFLLLSKWRSQPTEAINVKRFVRLLEYYQPGRVSLFLDACRSNKTWDAVELQGSGILDRSEDEPKEFLEDRFRPAKAGKEAFMIRDLAGGPAQCLFSVVLLKTLCGKYPEAVEQRGEERVVTTSRIYHTLRVRLAQEATRYRLTVTPSLKPGFVPLDDVYTLLPIDFVPPELPRPPPPTIERGPAQESEEQQVNALQANLVESFRRSYAREERPTHFESGCGLAVSGGQVKGEPAITPPARPVPDKAADGSTWWVVKLNKRQSASILVELDNGVSIGAAAIQGMITAISVFERAEGSQSLQGAASVIYRPVSNGAVSNGVPLEDLKASSMASEEIVSRLRAGTLVGDEALSVASRIRGMKHSNPMLGAIAAYLYDAVGDRDSIRRVAWFYAHYKQPIPFDVALLAGLKGKRGNEGEIRVNLPAIAQREPRTQEEMGHPDYFQETPAQDDVIVAGGFPWLRQGWVLLDLTSLPLHPGIVELARHVLPMPFTTLDRDGGQRLGQLIQQGQV